MQELSGDQSQSVEAVEPEDLDADMDDHDASGEADDSME
jgi:hypothetical protein